MQIVGTSMSEDVPLMEAGLTSLGALRLGRSLEGRLSTDIPGTLAFDYPSLASIASFVIN